MSIPPIFCVTEIRDTFDNEPTAENTFFLSKSEAIKYLEKQKLDFKIFWQIQVGYEIEFTELSEGHYYYSAGEDEREDEIELREQYIEIKVVEIKVK